MLPGREYRCVLREAPVFRRAFVHSIENTEINRRGNSVWQSNHWLDDRNAQPNMLVLQIVLRHSRFPIPSQRAWRHFLQIEIQTVYCETAPFCDPHTLGRRFVEGRRMVVPQYTRKDRLFRCSEVDRGGKS